jgi:hypothetical protein
MSHADIGDITTEQNHQAIIKEIIKMMDKV